MTINPKIDEAMIDRGTPPRPSGQAISLEIDGIPVTVPAGTSLMRAASLAGIQVPKLCATDSLEAFGSCRLCLVEIAGRKGTPASCTTPAENGMKVFTQTDRIAKLRRGVMELYISDHPLDCLTCAANGDCELQDREPPWLAQGRIQSVLHLRSVEVHRLFALRARLRRGAKHLRADHRRARFRQPRVGGHE